MQADSGDQEAFVAFVHARQAALLRAAYLVCGDRHLAEDLLQQALMKLAQRWHRVSSGGDPDAYVRTILYRDAISWWRHANRRLVHYPDVSSETMDPTHAVEQRLQLAEALTSLTPKQRAVLVLRYFEDLSEAQTAEVLRVSVGTVKSQASAALRRLRHVMTGPHEFAVATRRKAPGRQQQPTEKS